MTQKLFRIIFCMILLCIAVFPLSAQEEAEATPKPTIPYFTASDDARKFNVPIPAGWSSTETGDRAHLTISREDSANIYTLAVDGATLDEGLANVLENVAPEVTVTPHFAGQVNIDGVDWYQNLYDIDGGTITIFSQQRDNVLYSVVYVNESASDYYMLAARPEEGTESRTVIEETIATLYPDASAELTNSDTVELSNGPWARDQYSLDDETLYVLSQQRGANLFMVVERGDGSLASTVKKAFFTVIFGFFVTPENSSYLNLGLGVVAALLILFVVSMILRTRSLQKDLVVIRQLQNEA